MDRTGGLDVEREPRPPDPLCRLDLAAAAIARNLELRHRRSLRRRKRNFEIPSRRCRIGRPPASIDTIRQRRHLQQGLARNRGVGIAEQMMRTGCQRRIGRDRWRGNRLRRGQRAAKWRRRRVGMDGDVVVASIFQRCRCQRCVAVLPRNFLQRLLQQIQRSADRRRTRPGLTSVSGSTIRTGPVPIVIGDRGTGAPCGRRISCTSISGDSDGASVDVAAACGEMRLRCGQEPRQDGGFAAPLLRDARPAYGCAERRQKRLTKHDQCGLQIGYAGCRRNRSRRQRSLEKKPGFLKGILDVAAGQILIEAGPLRQHLHDRLLQFWRQAAGPGDDAEICKQRRQASLLCGRALRRRRDGQPPQAASIHCPGRRGTERRFAAAAGDGASGARVTVSEDAGRRAGARSDDREPDTVRRLRYRKLQGLAGLQAEFPREHRSKDLRSRSAPDCRREA